LRHTLTSDIGLNRNLGGMKPFQDFDELRDFLLAFRRQDIVSLHVVDVVTRVRHVIRSEH